MRRLLFLVAVIAWSGCSSSTPTTPTRTASSTPAPVPAPAPTPAPAPPTTYTLSGALTDGTSHGVLPNILVEIIDGTNNGRSTRTDATGHYVLSNIATGTFTMSFSATSYVTQTRPVALTGTTTVDIVLQRVPPAPVPAPTPTPSPTPAPAPTPTPTPSGSVAFYLWGGPTYTQYLGSFTCIFCTEFASDSINNLFGTYGSQFSGLSIRNQFGTYGSQFSNSSPCNQFASNPPRVFNANGSVFYGALTINQFAQYAITSSVMVGWLRGDICAH